MAKWRPKFDTIYQGEWPYKGHEGVGLHLRGCPRTPEDFALLLGHYGCPDTMATLVTEALVVYQEHKVTVAHNLDFDKMAGEMAMHYVSIEIIPPRKDWKLPT